MIGRVKEWVCVRAGNRRGVGHVVRVPRPLFDTEMDADWYGRAVPLKHKTVAQHQLQPAAHDPHTCPFAPERAR